MQKINSNIIILIFSFCCFITPSINCQKSNLDIADSLFYKEKYNESKNYYDSLYFINKLYTESMLLKMAFIEEQLENYEKSIYYLSLYQKINNDDNIENKIDKLVSENQLKGYEKEDKDYIISYFISLRSEIILLLVSISIIIFLVNIYRVLNKNRPNFLIKLFFLANIGLLVVLNYNFPKEAIVFHNNTFIMNGPSSGSDVYMLVKKGEKLNVTNELDVWYEISVNNNKKYVRKKNLKLIN